jgi:hypothetical protein
MTEQIFINHLDLRFKNQKIESDYQNIKDKKLSIMCIPVAAFSLFSCMATVIFQYCFYDQYGGVKMFKFSFISTCIAFCLYAILLILVAYKKDVKTKRWINYIIFYFQIFAIVAFRYTIFRVAKVSSILLFLQYLFETIVRLLFLVLLLQSFLESLVLNIISLSTVWLIVPFLIPDEFYNDEILNTLNYSFVILGIISVSYVFQQQQKRAFYFQWKAGNKATWLTNVIENLSSGFISVKNGKINYINSFFINILADETSKKEKYISQRGYSSTECNLQKKLYFNLFKILGNFLLKNIEGKRTSNNLAEKVELEIQSEYEKFNPSIHYLISHLNYEYLGKKNLISLYFRGRKSFKNPL